MFDSLKKKFVLGCLKGNYKDLVVNCLSCINDDSLSSQLYRKLFGLDRWCERASKKFTQAEQYIYAIEQFGDSVEYWENNIYFSKEVC